MKALLTLLLIAMMCISGCSHGRRVVTMAGSGAIGGGAGYVLFDKSPLAAGIGAATGAILGSTLMGEDEEALLESYNEGYIRASSNSIKRQYWLKQALEQPSYSDGSKMVYYTLPGCTEAEDGRKLVDHTVTIPILE